MSYFDTEWIFIESWNLDHRIRDRFSFPIGRQKSPYRYLLPPILSAAAYLLLPLAIAIELSTIALPWEPSGCRCPPAGGLSLACGPSKRREQRVPAASVGLGYRPAGSLMLDLLLFSGWNPCELLICSCDLCSPASSCGGHGADLQQLQLDQREDKDRRESKGNILGPCTIHKRNEFLPKVWILLLS